MHIQLAELLAMDGSTALVTEWPGRMRAAWAVHAAEGGGNIGTWLNGDAAKTVACDAAMAPVVTGEVNPAALENLVGQCVQLHRLRHGTPGRRRHPMTPPVPGRPRTPAGRGRRSSRP